MSNVADVYDMECIKSQNPLRLGLTSSFVRGATAILHRVIRRWCIQVGSVEDAPDLGVPIPILDIDGVTMSTSDLQGFRASLENQAREEDFVTAAVVNVTLVNGLLSISARITLTDGLTYSLEVGPAGAVAELTGYKISDSTIALVIAIYKDNPI